MQVDEPDVLELPAGQAVHVEAIALLNVFGKQAVHFKKCGGTRARWTVSWHAVQPEDTTPLTDQCRRPTQPSQSCQRCKLWVM